ncbi:TetR/AcrR family transcriptional regulator [Mycobacteroides abscessus subsp. bolletii]|nr:TetR/AcrR family transcriptional regulator [Mycobacteroides abscessus subsp. bolletii]
MVQQAFQRARTSAHKREREQALLTAARAMVDRNGVQSTTLTDIANETGLHYSAVRRYFGSRDAVMLQLVVEGWDCWASRVCERFLCEGSLSAEGYVDIIGSTLASDGIFCELLGNLPTFLGGASEHELRLVNRRVAAATSRITCTVSSLVPEVAPEAVEELVVIAAVLAAAMPHVRQIAVAESASSEGVPHSTGLVNELRRLAPTAVFGA